MIKNNIWKNKIVGEWRVLRKQILKEPENKQLAKKFDKATTKYLNYLENRFKLTQCNK